MTVKGGSTPACAACKYQRRKCSPICPLAPYFPANQPKVFQNVHRLFGVSNVTKTLQNIQSKDLKDDAMRSIIYEAEMRARFPVHGCCRVISILQNQLYSAYRESHYVCAALDACRSNLAGAASPLITFPNEEMSSDLSLIQSQMELLGIQERNMVDSQFVYSYGHCYDTQSYVETKMEARNGCNSSPESTLDDPAIMAEQSCRREMKDGAAVENGCRISELRTAAEGFNFANQSVTKYRF